MQKPWPPTPFPSARLGRRALLRQALALSLLAPAALLAQDLPSLVARAKPSVLLVGTFGALDSPRFGFRGTGFVVGDGNLAVTGAHVLPPLQMVETQERRLAVQVWGSDRQWTPRMATVLVNDPAHDVALLRFDGPPAPALRLAGDVSPPEGSDIALIGFPIGGLLGYSHVTHRGVVAAHTAISLPSLNAQTLNARNVAQLRQGAFEVLQLDIISYPGNSGGPVLDIASGEVVGVLSMALIKNTRESALSSPTGISYAMPVRHVRALMSKASVEDKGGKP